MGYIVILDQSNLLSTNPTFMGHISVCMNMLKSFILCFAESESNVYELVVSKRKVFYCAGY